MNEEQLKNLMKESETLITNKLCDVCGWTKDVYYNKISGRTKLKRSEIYTIEAVLPKIIEAVKSI